MIRLDNAYWRSTTTTYHEAKPLADELVVAFAPYCIKVEIAGSIRRLRSDVGDIEILAEPKLRRPEFGDDPTKAPYDLLTDFLTRGLAAGTDLRLRRNAQGQHAFGHQNKLLVYRGFALDVFSATPENWGMAYFVRTGPDDWNKMAMQQFIDNGQRGHAYGGVTDRFGDEMECPAETDVFEFLGWPWTEPENRTPELANYFLRGLAP